MTVTATVTSLASVIEGATSAASVTDPRDGTAAVTAGAVAVVASVLDEALGVIFDEAGAGIADE